MKRLSIGTLLISILFLSCAKNDGQEEQPDNGTTGRTVRREVKVRVAPMQSAGEGKEATRAGSVPLSADEKKIHNLWVLQFPDSYDSAELTHKDEVPVSEIDPTTGAFDFDFDESTKVVYLLANFPSSVLDGIPLGTWIYYFEQRDGLSVTPLTEATMKTNGLPMIALTSTYNISREDPIELKSLLAKVVFKYNTSGGFTFYNANLFAKNLSNTVLPRYNATNNNPVENSLTLVGDGTYSGGAETVCYLPENKAGTKTGITQASERGGSNVPSNATYICLEESGSLSPISYSFYLGDGTVTDFNLKRHCRYTVNMTLQGANTTDKRVTLKTANCYIIDTSDAPYAFLGTVMGNGATTPDAGANAPEIKPTPLVFSSVKVLWEQSYPGESNAVGNIINPGGLTTNGTYIQFFSGTKPGNAVIGAFNDAGTLIWSWHIWRPASKPGDVLCHTPYPTATGGRDFTMMGLNLGAFNNNENDVGAYGLMYQWGRKDPFPGATGISANDGSSATFNGVVTENGYSFAAVSGSVTAQAAIAVPMSFYYEGSRTDWVSTQQDNLWGNPYTNSSVSPNPDLGSKSIYDPCPYGYRIPPQDTWSQAANANSTWATNGYQLGVGTGVTPAKFFYPAAGVRWGDSGVGKLADVGSVGYYWSSSPNSKGSSLGGNMLFIGGSGIGTEGNSYRAYGISVRCMKE